MHRGPHYAPTGHLVFDREEAIWAVPFNPETAIGYDLAEPGEVTLKVYNLLGQEVRTLLSETVRPGRYSVTWDAEDDSGRPVAGGVYVYRLQTGTTGLVRKMVLLK